MGSQALRTDFELEEEDRFFISGVEKVGRSRNTYEHQLRKRKVLVGVLIAVCSLGLVALIIGLGWGLSHRKLDYVCPRTYDPGNTDLVFYVIGDWGRAGSEDQQKAARLMSDVSQCMPPKFVISTGDNFYPSGLSSPADPQFQQSFTSVYSAPGLQVPWYAVMGNHDYGDSADDATLTSCLSAPTSEKQCEGKCCISPFWQTVPELAARDGRWNATLGNVVTRTFLLGAASSASGSGGTLDILFVDTVPMIYQYESRRWASFLYGFKNQSAHVEDIKASLVRQLNTSLAGGSKWRLVVGHHPVRSYGSHCSQPDPNDCMDMAFLRPWLREYRVAAYLNGHEHDQQLIKSDTDPVYYVTSGAGSETRAGEFDNLDSDERSKDALFLSDKQGFLAVVFSGASMKLHFYTTGQSGPTYTRVVPAPSSST
ncbi:Purple acid phosphatase [Volvox africanus]|uniref:Purple acid phosphatase n=1 Tax=Volvox africanus TaxID=51714 RepID=A0ABQ5S0M4_9CHLO|nr:Purple acid phosphatase [Volvox africanus]